MSIRASGASRTSSASARGERAADAVLDALGSPMRRAILRVVAAGPHTVGAIAAKLPVSRPAISRHLKQMEDAHLVVLEPRGTQTLVRLDRNGFEAARRWLEGFWDEALPAFAAVAERPRGARGRPRGGG